MAKKAWKVIRDVKATSDPKYAPTGREIVSVSRRSDKSIFSIGDECKLKYTNTPIGKITRIWIEGDWWNEQVRVAFGELEMTLSWKDHEDIIIK